MMCIVCMQSPHAADCVYEKLEAAEQRADAHERQAEHLRRDLQEIAKGTGINVPDTEEAKRRIIALRAEVDVLRAERDGPLGYKDELNRRQERILELRAQLAEVQAGIEECNGNGGRFKCPALAAKPAEVPCEQPGWCSCEPGYPKKCFECQRLEQPKEPDDAPPCKCGKPLGECCGFADDAPEWVMVLYRLGKDGAPVAVEDPVEWARWLEGIGEGRVVGQDEHDGVKVSTVFLGMDHRFMGEGPPVLWETTVFGGDQDQAQERYTSAMEARLGHIRWCLTALGRGPGWPEP